MSRTILATVVGLLMAAPARAEVVVELVPDDPGPYYGGETLIVDVWLHSEVDYYAPLAWVRFDFSASDASLSLDTAFAFDYSSLAEPHGYDDDGLYSPDLPLPETYNGWAIACEGIGCSNTFLTVPPAGSFHLGSIGLELPAEPGAHRLDLLNASDPNPDLGAMFALCCSPFYPDPVWRAYTGEISGGTYDFTVRVVPAVSEWGLVSLTLLLLTAGCLTIRRRAAV